MMNQPGVLNMKFYKLLAALFLSMFLTVAFAGEHAGKGADKKEHAGEKAEHAGEKAEHAGKKAEHAGEKAESKEHAGKKAEHAGEAAEEE